jgi:hypothetical protein
VTQEYVVGLVGSYCHLIQSMWLFGSRANGRHRADSDWDYLLFADARLFSALGQAIRFHVANIDLFFVATPTQAMKPWNDADGYNKILNLADVPGGFAWRELSDIEATYNEHVARNPDDPNNMASDPKPAKAICVYRG